LNALFRAIESPADQRRQGFFVAPSPMMALQILKQPDPAGRLIMVQSLEVQAAHGMSRC